MSCAVFMQCSFMRRKNHLFVAASTFISCKFISLSFDYSQSFPCVAYRVAHQPHVSLFILPSNCRHDASFIVLAQITKSCILKASFMINLLHFNLLRRNNFSTSTYKSLHGSFACLVVSTFKSCDLDFASCHKNQTFNRVSVRSFTHLICEHQHTAKS